MQTCYNNYVKFYSKFGRAIIIIIGFGKTNLVTTNAAIRMLNLREWYCNHFIRTCINRGKVITTNGIRTNVITKMMLIQMSSNQMQLKNVNKTNVVTINDSKMSVIQRDALKSNVNGTNVIRANVFWPNVGASFWH